MAVKKQLRAIFLDIDDTLYSTSEFSRLARKNAVRAMIRHGLQISARQCLQELEEVVSEFTSNYPYHYNKLLARLGPESHPGINAELFIAAAVIAYHDTKSSQLKPFPDVLPFLRKAKKGGLKIGVITAGLATKQAEKILRLGIAPYIDTDKIFISEQIGISKPNPKLYLYALKRSGFASQEAIYIGDSSVSDIDPCNRIGMITVKVLRGGKHEVLTGKTKPTFEVSDFKQLWAVLRSEFLFGEE